MERKRRRGTFLACQESNLPTITWISVQIKLSECFCISRTSLYFLGKYDIVIAIIVSHFIKLYLISCLNAVNDDCVISVWHFVDVPLCAYWLFFRFRWCIFSHKSRIFCICTVKLNGGLQSLDFSGFVRFSLETWKWFKYYVYSKNPADSISYSFYIWENRKASV